MTAASPAGSLADTKALALPNKRAGCASGDGHKVRGLTSQLAGPPVANEGRPRQLASGTRTRSRKRKYKQQKKKERDKKTATYFNQHDGDLFAHKNVENLVSFYELGSGCTPTKRNRAREREGEKSRRLSKLESAGAAGRATK